MERAHTLEYLYTISFPFLSFSPIVKIRFGIYLYSNSANDTAFLTSSNVRESM